MTASIVQFAKSTDSQVRNGALGAVCPIDYTSFTTDAFPREHIGGHLASRMKWLMDCR